MRTIVNLEPSDKLWLDKKAHVQHVTMSEMVRRAIKHYRRCKQVHTKKPIESLLRETKGLWVKEDGLSYQEKIRSEFDDS